MRRAGPLFLPEQAAPATPPTGWGYLYIKSDGTFYTKNDAGTEVALGGGGSGLGDWGQQELHGAHSSGFNSPTDFGGSFVQGTADGPGVPSATQYYNWAFSLGSDHAYSQYAMQMAIPRTPVGGTPILSVRFREAGAWGSWQQVQATPYNDGDLVHKTGVETITGAKTLQASASNVTPLIVKGAAAQTGNLQEWKNNGDGVVAHVAADGSLLASYGGYSTTAPKLTVGDAAYGLGSSGNVLFAYGGEYADANPGEGGYSGGQFLLRGAVSGRDYFRTGPHGTHFQNFKPGVIGLIVQGAPSQAADVQRWQNSVGATLAAIDPVGTFSAAGHISTGASLKGTYVQNQAETGPYFAFDGTYLHLHSRVAANPALVIRGAASQTGDLIQFQNSVGSMIARVDGIGRSLFADTVNIRAIASSQYPMLFFTDTDDGIRVKMLVDRTTGDVYNDVGNHNATGGFVAFRMGSSYLTRAIVGNAHAGSHALQVRGVPSQTGNLLELQNSDGVSLMTVTAGGRTVSPYLGFSGPYIQATAETGTYLAFNANAYAQFYARNPASAALIIQGAAAQSGNLTEWWDSGTNGLLWVSASGVLTTKYPNNLQTLWHTDRVFNYNLQCHAASPAGKMWNDQLAFHRVGVPTQEKFTGGSWTADTLNGALFDGRGSDAYTVADGSTITAVRWTWNSAAISWSGWHVWMIASAYAAGQNKAVLIQSSADGVNWTTRHSSTGDNLEATTGWYWTSDQGPDSFMRLTLTTIGGLPIRITTIKAYSMRWADGSGGADNEMPFNYNVSRQVVFGPWGLTPGNGIVTIGSTTTDSSGGLWFAGDTNLYRAAASTLYTDGNLLGTAYSSSTGSPRRVGVGSMGPGHAGRLEVGAPENSLQTSYGGRTILQSYWGIVLRGSVQAGTQGFEVGNVNDSSVTVHTPASGRIGLSVRGQPAQAADLQRWEDNSATTLAKIRSDGLIGVPYITNTLDSGPYIEFAVGGVVLWDRGGGTGVQLNVKSNPVARSAVIMGEAGHANTVPLVAKGAASQVVDLQEWQNSGGTVVTRVEPSGLIGFGPPSTYDTYVGNPDVAAGATNTLITSVTASNKALIVKGRAAQTANLQEWQDSASTTLASVSASGHVATKRLLVFDTPYPELQLYETVTGGRVRFSGDPSGHAYIDAGHHNAAGGALYVRTSNGYLIRAIFGDSSAGNVAFRVRGMAGQTADLQQWQDNSPATVAKVGSAGDAQFRTATLAEVAAPSTPASGFASIYFKSDGLPYAKNDAGVEMPLFNDTDDIEFVAMMGGV